MVHDRGRAHLYLAHHFRVVRTFSKLLHGRPTDRPSLSFFCRLIAARLPFYLSRALAYDVHLYVKCRGSGRSCKKTRFSFFRFELDSNSPTAFSLAVLSKHKERERGLDDWSGLCRYAKTVSPHVCCMTFSWLSKWPLCAEFPAASLSCC
jgi:hypothetical protein